ncbi:helix-turn-helix domain-containing protein [Rummeliibacillus sp. TYF-LIM-RU47]|uniref:helix-turn-helix domain-containing protein n=1 Tax=Rummeliibacillus sp. TYF-LIM-RU47 TaxID=2608406 RepID=UPI00123A3854|nr:helix-turn-helix transcriptional regulator [Rummeliibacillus sp. TYF-LIM-RU47]
MSDFLRAVGNKIRKTRTQQGLTLEELAEKTELNFSYLGKIERGEKNITLLTLEKLVNTLNIPPSSLFDFNGTSQINNNLDKVLDNHEKLLQTRNVEEIKTIHSISVDIFKLLDNRKQ